MANGLVNFGLVNPELSDYAGQQQKRTQSQIGRLELERLTNERKIMLDFQKQLADKGQNPDLDFVFDTMIKTGNPNYVSKGLEGKSKLQEQKRFAQIMGYDMTPPAAGGAPAMAAPVMTPPAAAAPVNALTATAPSAAVAPANALVKPSKVDENAALTQKIDQLIALGTPQAIQAANALQGRLKQQSAAPMGYRFTDSGDLQAIPGGPADKRTGGGTEIPKLRPGEKWNAKEERVDLVPGSELYNKTASKHTKDYAAANSFATKSDDAIKKIDTILDPANKEGFESNFGGYNAYATRLMSGNTAKVRREIDSLQNALKVAGLDQIRQGGSIGAITQAEWPILQQMVAALTPDLNEEDARIKLQDIRAKFESIKADARDSYATTWDRTQFYKTKPGAASDKSGSDSGGVDTKNPLLN
jgi:hypothetical protein